MGKVFKILKRQNLQYYPFSQPSVIFTTLKHSQAKSHKTLVFLHNKRDASEETTAISISHYGSTVQTVHTE